MAGELTEEERIETAMKVAEELKKGGMTKEAIESFAKLIGKETLEELAPGPNFGKAPLPEGW